MSLVEVSVHIDDDSLWELNKTFFGNLRLPAGVINTDNITFQSPAMATILDNDGK